MIYEVLALIDSNFYVLFLVRNNNRLLNNICKESKRKLNRIEKPFKEI